MSTVERNKGIMILITDNPEHYARHLSKQPLSSRHESFVEQLQDSDEGSKYFVINGKLYKAKFTVESEDDICGFVETSVSDEGDITFHTMHYNGGGSLQDVIEGSLSFKKIK